jgi:molybdopterin molybdotransferase
MWFGVGPAGQAVFGLPGNPVSTLICLIRYVVPALAAAMGAPRTLAEPIALASGGKLGRSVVYFLPVTVRHDERGRRTAWPRIPNGSGDFLALAGTDGFVELPPRSEAFPEGFVAGLYRW